MTTDTTDTTEAPPDTETAAGAPAAPTPMIDPRLRARRIEVQREAGRRRLRLMVVVAIVAAVVVGLVGLVFSPLLAVQEVRVDGAVYADEAAVAAAVDGVRGEPLLTVDLSALRERLEAIPWVRYAEVHRAWRDRAVQVGVVERRPVAAFYAGDGRYRVVDAEGVVLATLDGQPIDVVGIGAPDGAGPALAPGERVPEVMAATAALANALPAELRGRVVELQVAADGSVTMQLQPSGQVLFGPPTEVRTKLLAVLTVLGDVAPEAIDTLDVRAPSSPVLTERAG